LRIRRSAFAAALAAACALGVAAGLAGRAGQVRPAAAQPADGTALAALTGPLTTAVADPLFMLINGIPGESLERDHRGWISVSGYHASLSFTAKSGFGAGSGGHAQFGPFTVDIPYSRAVLPLMRAVAAGRLLGTVELQAATLSGGRELNYLTITLTDVQATAIQETSSGGRPADTLTLTAGRIAVIYTPAGGATSTFCFDFRTARAC
jgi:type VI protein secretion system component Hcp